MATQNTSTFNKNILENGSIYETVRYKQKRQELCIGRLFGNKKEYVNTYTESYENFPKMHKTKKQGNILYPQSETETL